LADKADPKDLGLAAKHDPRALGLVAMSDNFFYNFIFIKKIFKLSYSK